MTAPDTAPRQALELLADYLEQVQRLDAVDEADLPITWEIMTPLVEAHQAVLSLDPVVLRAQAEAEAGLREAAAAYRGACAPLDTLLLAEITATAVCYDERGHYIGNREQYLAMHDAIDATAEQRGHIATAQRRLCSAALAQAGGDPQ